MAEIRKLLVLSTTHLTVEQREALDAGDQGRTSLDGATFYGTEYGGLLWVPDDPVESAKADEDEVAGNLLAIQVRARGLGCDYVLFDRDAEELEGLESFPEEIPGQHKALEVP